MSNYRVYFICFPNQTVYVGRTSNLDRRMDTHFYTMRQGKHHNLNVQEQWNNYHQFNVTEIMVEDVKSATFWEQHFIDYFRKRNRSLNIGAATNGGDNFTHHPKAQEIKEKVTRHLMDWKTNNPDKRFIPAGDKNPMWGKTHTAEARAKISKINLGVTRRSGFTLSQETKRKLSEKAKLRVGDKNPFFGKEHSAKTKAILAEKNKGKIPPNRCKVSINDVVYDSFHHANQALGIPVVTIRWRALSENPLFNNYFLINDNLDK